MISPRMTRALAVATSAALVLGGVLLTASPAAAAADYTVTDPSGGNTVGTLRDAIAFAESDPGLTTIDFGPGLSGQTISLLANLVITTPVEIDGPGSGALTIKGPPTNDSVFDISNVGVRPTVKITGVTILPGAVAPATVNAHGINADDTALTLLGVTVNGFDDSGIDAQGSALTATQTNANSNGNYGIEFFGGVGDELHLDHVVADDNAVDGVNAGVDTADATITTLTATGNTGWGLRFSGGGTSTLSDITTKDNDAGGVFVINGTGSAVTLDASLLQHNGHDLCGCGGPGLTVIGVGGSITVSNTRILDNSAKTGGGVHVYALLQGATLAITGSTISGNQAVDSGNGAGGGIEVDDTSFFGGFDDAGTALTITDSTISNNHAELEGGGAAFYDIGLGGASDGITFLRTTIDNNTVGDLPACGCGNVAGGVLLAGGGATPSGGPILSFQQSTISNNSVIDGDGGGLYLAQGPGPYPAIVDVVDSTISGNSVDGNGAAVYVDITNSDPGMFHTFFRYSTIAANHVTGGGPGTGGLFVDGDLLDLDLESTILASNDNGDLLASPSIDILSSAFNLIQVPDPGIVSRLSASDILGVDPLLGPLANNGGPTQTMLIAPGSPAYNAGDPAFAGIPANDQRGQLRVYQVVDIGATEWHPALALTGGGPRPETPLIALLLLFVGTALVAGSRLRALP